MPFLTLRLSFELAFGDGSPYSEMFPSLYGLPRPVNQAITQEVMDKVIAAVAEVTGVEEVDTIYGAGGYKTYPVTLSGQATLHGQREALLDFMDAIGYLAQQSEVFALRPAASGKTQFFDIVQGDGQQMADPMFVRRFWEELLVEYPKMAQGFQPIRVDGKPGIRIINSDQVWIPQVDYPLFHQALEKVERLLRIEVEYQEGRAEFLRSGNDWTKDKEGNGYLQRFNSRRRSAIRRRLVAQLQPRTEWWITEAFQQHAPGEFRRFHERATDGGGAS